jgi:endonuclease YncB( thermonuclease family)
MVALGQRSAEHMKVLLAGKRLILVFPAGHQRRDHYGRFLAYVEADGVDLGAQMIRDGFAFSFRRYPHPRLEAYDALFRQAVEGKAGLWADAEADRVRKPDPPQAQKKKKPGRPHGRKRLAPDGGTAAPDVPATPATPESAR